MCYALRALRRASDMPDRITFSAYGAAFGHYQLLAFAVMWRG
jgi:hypothetical protein